MTLALLAHQIEMIPTAEHEQYFRKACGVKRFTYNWGLSEWKKEFTEGKKPNWMALRKKLNSLKEKEFPWMYEVTKCAPEAALADLGTAWANYFRDRQKGKGRKSQKPVFKKKGRSRDQFYLSNDQFVAHGKEVDPPHIGKVPLREGLRFAGKIMGACISRKADRWFISIQVETDVSHLKLDQKGIIGIDLGVAFELVLSNGKKYTGPKAIRKYLKKLARLNRQLHRKEKGSNSRMKAALKVARLQRKIGNIRSDFIHKVTTSLTKKHGIFGLEDLNTAGMLKNHKLARALSDASFHEIKRQLEYKSGLRGGKVIYVDRFFASTRKCRKCGVVNSKLDLKDRVFWCLNSQCKHTEDRDVHAARNIRKEITLGRRGIYADGHQASIPKKSRKRFLRRKPGGLKSERCIKT